MPYALKKAVIPAGGLGSRMSLLAGSIPKEMLLLGHRPMIRWCIEEAFQSGVREIAIVLNEKKRGIRDYLTRVETERPNEGDRIFREALRHCVLAFIDQPEPRGSGDAINRCRSFVGEEPFAVMMPDFVLFDSKPALNQMVEAAGKEGQSVVGFLRLGCDEAGTFGNVGVLKTEEAEGPIHRILDLSGKKPGTLILERGAWISKAVGRVIFHPDFFDVFDAIPWKETEELDDVPVIQRLVEEKKLIGVHLDGHGFDVGNPEGYRAANAYLKRIPFV